jgi:hypothetical protein
MTTQLLTPTPPAPVRQHHLRNAAIAAGVTAVIAAGGYVASTTFGPDSIPSPSAPATTAPITQEQALREMRTAIAGQYGARSTSDATVNPGAQVRRELRESVAGQYGMASAPDAMVDPSAQALRELRQSVAGQYGARSTSDATVSPSAQVQRELRDSIAGQYGQAR